MSAQSGTPFESSNRPLLKKGKFLLFERTDEETAPGILRLLVPHHQFASCEQAIDWLRRHGRSVPASNLAILKVMTVTNTTTDAPRELS